MAAPDSHDHPVSTKFPPLSDGHGGQLDTGPIERLWGAKAAGCSTCYARERDAVLNGPPTLLLLAVFYAYQLMESWRTKTGEALQLPDELGPAFRHAAVLIEQEPMEPLAAAASLVTGDPGERALLLRDAVTIMALAAGGGD